MTSCKRSGLGCGCKSIGVSYRSIFFIPVAVEILLIRALSMVFEMGTAIENSSTNGVIC